MRHVDYRQMAMDVFCLVVQKRLELTITPEQFQNSSPKISLIPEKDGVLIGEVSVSSDSASISATVRLVEVAGQIYASAVLTKCQDLVVRANRLPAKPWAYAEYSVAQYSIECDDCN